MKKILGLILAMIFMMGCTSVNWFLDDGDKVVYTTENPKYTVPDLGTKDEVLAWVEDSIDYVGDDKQWGVGEYWQTPEETLMLGTGDCEDFSILAMFLLNKIGVYSELVLCDVGFSINDEWWGDQELTDNAWHAIIWIYNGSNKYYLTYKDYYEPQRGIPVYYELVVYDHINYYTTMYMARYIK